MALARTKSVCRPPHRNGSAADEAERWRRVQVEFDLTDRQTRILQVLSASSDIACAAATLDVSETAIEAHIDRMLRELEFANLDSLLAAANAVLRPAPTKPAITIAAEEESDAAARSPALSASADMLMLAKQLVGLFAAGYRLDLLGELVDRPKDVSTLAKAIDASLSTTSQNLRCLRDLKLVRYEREKLQYVYRLAPGVKGEVEENALALTLPGPRSRSITIRITVHEET